MIERDAQTKEDMLKAREMIEVRLDELRENYKSPEVTDSPSKLSLICNFFILWCTRTILSATSRLIL